MNSINYAKGLLQELDMAVQRGAKDVEASVRTELKWAADEVKKVDVSQLEEDAKTELRAVVTRLEEVLGGSKRTAKAASAPETATPPAAK